MTNKNSFPETYGLVMCGGQSSRMGTDKSMLQYYDKPQRYHVYDMLQPFCEKVFISCSKELPASFEKEYNFIQDSPDFGPIGPPAALLTAFSQYPGKNILFIGCDYPFLKADELVNFSSYCNNEPAAFYNDTANIYEPVLAWYPHSCFAELKAMFEKKLFSLQQFLKNKNAIKYLPTGIESIKSVDTKDEFVKALKLINEV